MRQNTGENERRQTENQLREDDGGHQQASKLNRRTRRMLEKMRMASTGQVSRADRTGGLPSRHESNGSQRNSGGPLDGKPNCPG